MIPPKISLTSARVNAGMTQSFAANLFGISRDTLRAYETGKTSPSWDFMQRVEQIYKYPIDFIRV